LAVSPPNAWQVEQAMSAWNSARERLAAETGEDDISALLRDETQDVNDILARALRAADEAKRNAQAAKDRMADIKARADRFARQEEALRSLAFSIMDVLGERKFALPDLTASIRPGQPSALIVDPDAVPDEYVKVTRAPDKAAILADLKQGVVIAGAELSNSMPSLQIRSK
jgi:hypothetical protein